MPNLSKWRLRVGYGLLLLAIVTDSALWLLSLLMDGAMIGAGIYFIMSYVTIQDKKNEPQTIKTPSGRTEE